MSNSQKFEAAVDQFLSSEEGHKFSSHSEELYRLARAQDQLEFDQRHIKIDGREG